MGIFGRIFTIDAGARDSYNQGKIKRGLFSKLFHSNRIAFIKKINKELQKDIADLREYVLDFNRKIQVVNKYMKSKTEADFVNLKKEIKEIKKIVSDQFALDKKEGKIVLKAIVSIDKALNREIETDISNDENEIRRELTELKIDIMNLEPIIEDQLRFLKLKPGEQRKQIKEFMHAIHEEAQVIGYEKKFLKELKNSIEKYEIDAVIAPE